MSRHQSRCDLLAADSLQSVRLCIGDDGGAGGKCGLTGDGGNGGTGTPTGDGTVGGSGGLLLGHDGNNGLQ
jgi:hypothetical protein